jgi:hypothetical protein
MDRIYLSLSMLALWGEEWLTARGKRSEGGGVVRI